MDAIAEDMAAGIENKHADDEQLETENEEEVMVDNLPEPNQENVEEGGTEPLEQSEWAKEGSAEEDAVDSPKAPKVPQGSIFTSSEPDQSTRKTRSCVLNSKSQKVQRNTLKIHGSLEAAYKNASE